MKSFLVITRSVLRRLLSIRRVSAMLAVAALPALLLFLITGSGTREEVLTSYDAVTAILTLSVVFAVIGLVFSIAALGEERYSHTLSDLLMKPVPRVVIVLAATTAAILASFLLMAAGALLEWLVVAGRIGDFTLEPVLFPTALLQAVGLSALFVPMGLLVRRAALLGLLYIFAWESVLANLIDGLKSTSLARIAISAWVDWSSVTPASFDSEDIIGDLLGRVEPSAGESVVKTVVLLLLSILVTSVVLRRGSLITAEGE